MPNLQHLPQYERHLTLAALAHCPRDYWYTDQVRRGLLDDEKSGDSLAVGILVHYGLEALWKQRQGTALWTPSVALDVMDAKMGADLALALLKDKGALVDEAKKAVLDYAEQWTGVRDHWRPVTVAPVADPPEPWTVLRGEFVSYPDLIIHAGPMYPTVVVDHKTSMWKFEADKWEWHPELLTQCLAAKQLEPNEPIFYMIDFLQRPGKRSNVWSFPATPIWEFTERKVEAAREWMRHLIERRDEYRIQQYEGRETEGGLAIERVELPWPQELSQCQTPWGLCRWYKRCFGDAA